MLPDNLEKLRFSRNCVRIIILGMTAISIVYSFISESDRASICRTIALVAALIDWPFESKVRRIGRAENIAKINRLEARLTHRHLPPDKRAILIKGLSEVSKELVKHPEVEICYLSVSTEALRYAEQIQSAFIDSGMPVSARIGKIPIPDFRGICVCGTRPEVNDAFENAGIHLMPDPRPFFPLRSGCFVWVGEKEDESQPPKPTTPFPPIKFAT